MQPHGQRRAFEPIIWCLFSFLKIHSSSLDILLSTQVNGGISWPRRLLLGRKFFCPLFLMTWVNEHTPSRKARLLDDVSYVTSGGASARPAGLGRRPAGPPHGAAWWCTAGAAVPAAPGSLQLPSLRCQPCWARTLRASLKPANGTSHDDAEGSLRCDTL